MPKLSLEPIAETRSETTIEPKLRKQLLTKLQNYQRLHAQFKALETALATIREEIGTLRDDTGEMSITLDGFKVTLVAGERKKLNQKKLIALGCAPAWITEATDIRPTKSYNKVTLPGEQDRNEDDHD